MNIYVVDGLNGITNIIDAYKSVIWNVQYYGTSDFELTVIANDSTVNTLTKGKYLVRDIDVKNGEYNNVMIIESRALSFDVETGWLLTLRGKGLKNLLRRRIAWNQISLTGKIEFIIRQLIIDNVINPADPARKIDDFVLDAEQEFTEEMIDTESDNQLTGEKISEWISSICERYSIGWDIYIKDGKYHFKLYKGIDRTYDQSDVPPVIFSPEFDNLIRSTVTEDITDFCNAAIVAGEGEGTAQRIVSIGEATGVDRYESYIDASSVSSNGKIITLDVYMQMLTNYGNEQLKKAQQIINVEGEIYANGVYKINEDYFLGDLVQIENEYKISAQARIIEIIYSEDENGSSVIPTFGKWESEV